jgi:site-specific DNA-methyltransferase (adenine-specific)
LIEPCVLAGCPKGGIVLDPFGGSGTTAGVALKHGRDALLIELNPEYVELIDKRIESILNFKIKDETRNELF